MRAGNVVFICNQSQLIRSSTAPLGNDQPMFIVQVWPARLDGHFKIVLLTTAFFELALVALVVRGALNTAY